MSQRLVVAESSLLIDVERGCVEAAAFASGLGICVPDLLYERELEPYGDRLSALGLEVLELDGVGVQQAVRYQRLVQSLSLSHAFALALAQRTRASLLTSEARLRRLATDEGVACHGILWLREHIRDRQDGCGEPSCDGFATLSDLPRGADPLPGPSIIR